MDKVKYLWLWIVFAYCGTLGSCTIAKAADGEAKLYGENGQYAAGEAAPDNLTTLPPDDPQFLMILKVTRGEAAAERVLDQGKVHLSAMRDDTAEFSGRSTGWGCVYTVHGKFSGGLLGGEFGGKAIEWDSKFEAVEPRLLLEINESGAGDDVLLTGGAGKLVLDVSHAPGVSVTVALSVTPPERLPTLPASVSFTAGTKKEVPLSGAGTGDFTITSSVTVNSKSLSESVSGMVSSFRGKLIPADDFANRSRLKLGVGETGTLGVELATGITLANLKPLKWKLEPMGGNGLTLSDENWDEGTANFTAANTYREATISLEAQGVKHSITVYIVEPNGVTFVKGDEGKLEPGSCSAYLALYAYLRPVDVSFWKIRVIEGKVLPTEASGSQIQFINTEHIEWTTGHATVQKRTDSNSSEGSFVEGPNAAGAWNTNTDKPFDYTREQDELNVGEGIFSWNIPWQYSLGSVVQKEFCRVLHKSVYDGARKITLSKGEITTEQTGP